MSNRWTDELAGVRMQVDRQFNDRILNSRFTNQEWGLIMTAVEFDIENPEQPEEAKLVAQTEDVAAILPEAEKVRQQMGGVSGSGSRGSSGGSLFGKLGGIFGFGDSFGGSVDTDRLEAATELADEYAGELQKALEEQGRWEDTCETAAQRSKES